MTTKDVTVHLRGGQSISIRVTKIAWKTNPVAGGLISLEINHDDAESNQLDWVRVEAIDAIEITAVQDSKDDQ